MTILENLNKRLTRVKGRWLEKLLSMLWPNKTTKRESIGETPLSMVYGTKAIILIEVQHPTIRKALGHSIYSTKVVQLALDQSKKLREKVHVKIQAYQYCLKKYYEKMFKTRTLSNSDLVLRCVM